ncbi:class I SAM-dependent methyltransferase [Salinarimonas ramus]|nr:class I SAM-dependent methyltransferase [Salinarimonas ramus]
MPTSPDIRFWDKAARKYAARPVGDEAGLERTLARTRELLPAGARVLELGCGTASSALRLAPHAGRIVASDASGEMIAIAREKVAQAGVANVEPVQATADAVPEAPGGYDAVIAFNLLHLVPDRAALYARVRALLAPGGVFVSKTPCLSEMNPAIRLVVPLMRLIGKAPSVAWFDAKALEAEIVAAGFSIVERDRHGSGKSDPRLFLVARAP